MARTKPRGHRAAQKAQGEVHRDANTERAAGEKVNGVQAKPSPSRNTSTEVAKELQSKLPVTSKAALEPQGGLKLQSKSSKRRKSKQSKGLVVGKEAYSSVDIANAAPKDNMDPPAKRARPNFYQGSFTFQGLNSQPSVELGKQSDAVPDEVDNENLTKNPHLNLPQDLSQFNTIYMKIISSSAIQSKVTRIISTLAAFNFREPIKPSVVVLQAMSSVASKLISIVEIAKREIAREGGKCYQYSQVDGVVTELKDQGKAKTDKGGKTLLEWEKEMFAEEAQAIGKDQNVGLQASEGPEDTEEDAFEVMEGLQQDLNRPKVRAIPKLTIFLSRVRVPKLEECYG